MVRHRELLKNRLNTECFLISGPLIWKRHNLVEKLTLYSHESTLWIYTHLHTSMMSFSRKGTHYQFIQRNYPTEITPEWWIVDLLNYYNVIPLTVSQCQALLHEKLSSNQLDPLRLYQLSEMYSDPQSKRILQSCLVDYLYIKPNI